MTSTYYCDLFEINGKGCVVMGSGKSVACRDYTGETTKEIMKDYALFNIEDGRFIAYEDLSFCGNFPLNIEKCTRMPVDYFLWMQFEDEESVDSIKEVSPTDFCEIARFNILFGVAETDMDARFEEFKNMITADDHIKCIIVPWCQTVEQKGKLISDYI